MWSMGDTCGGDEDNHRHYDSHDAGPEWGTPEWIWRPLADALGGFDLDPASGAEPEPIATTRMTRAEDGLRHPWFGHVWLNPPYGRGLNVAWGREAYTEARRDEVESLTALVPASTDTQWFKYYADADLLTFVEGRIEFVGAGDSGASFASVIATWGDVPIQYIRALHEVGFVARPIDETTAPIHEGGGRDD